MRISQLFLIVAGAALLAGCNSKATNETSAATPVRVAAATSGPAAPSIRTNGLLANKDEIRLAFKVGGVIRKLVVSEGERVRKGQRLAQIEQTEVNASVEQARQAHEKAKRDAARGERLFHDKVISLEQLQDLRTQAAMAEAALNSAEFNWNYAAIVAPRDGTVLRRLAEERELVAAGAPVLVFGGQERGFVVRAGLADREIVQVRIGDSVRVKLDALPDATLDGKVTEIASAADGASGMFGIEVAIDSQAELPLKSGLVAKLTIVPASALSGSRVYVPIGAIVEGDGRNARLFVLDNDRARRRDIEVAFIEGAVVAVASGVDVGEQVITDGAQYLEDGERVAISKPVATSAQL
jgi:multidrug efflux system membrane fusion protein